MTKSFSYYLLPTLVRAAVGILLLVPVTTYYLEPSDFGVLAILSVITGVLLPLVNVGGTWVLGANYFHLTPDEKKELLFTILFLDFCLRLALLSGLWLARGWLLPLFVQSYRPEYDTYFLLLLSAMMCVVFWPTVSYLLVIQRHSPRHAAFEVFQTLVGAAVMCALLMLFHLRGISLFIAPLITNFSSLVLELCYLRRHVTFKIRRRWLKEILHTGVPSIPANASEALSSGADRFFIEKWANLSMLGIYAHSQTYYANLKTVNKAFARTVNPVALKAFTTGRSTAALAHQLRVWYALITAGGTAVIFFGRDALNLLTHGKFVAAAPLLIVWVYIMLSHSVGLAAGQFLLSRKATRTLSVVQTCVWLLSIGLIAAAVYGFSILGAAIAVVASNLCIQLIFIYKANKLGNPYRDHLAVLAPASLLALMTLIQHTAALSFSTRLAIALPVIAAALGYAWHALKRAHEHE